MSSESTYGQDDSELDEDSPAHLEPEHRHETREPKLSSSAIDTNAVLRSALASIQSHLASGDFWQSAVSAGIKQLQSKDYGSSVADALARMQAKGLMQTPLSALRTSQNLGYNPSLLAGVQERLARGDFAPTIGQIARQLADSANEIPSSYSAVMHGPESYFAHTEGLIESFDDLHAITAHVTSKNPRLRFVWRGARSAAWGLHSGLFRRLMEHNGVQRPDSNPIGPQPFPDESQLIRAEEEMLQIARSEWRMDDSSPLEVFARLQHYGAPTRLIDISKNPYIGAWFATEPNLETDDEDGRLFAIATNSVPLADDPDREIGDTTTRQLTTDGLPAWHAFSSTRDRLLSNWGTGTQRRIWVPPAYDPRIVAQNAGFILDGVPLTSQTTAPYFKVDASSTYWKRADLLASGSIYAKMYNPKVPARPNRPGLAPTFSWRITPRAKREIRQNLTRVFGYTRAVIYPDIAALGAYLRDEFASYAPSLTAEQEQTD